MTGILGALGTLSDTIMKLTERDLLEAETKVDGVRKPLDPRLPGHRPILAGDVRRKEIGEEFFRRERRLGRSHEYTRWEHTKPYATQYNETVAKALHNERLKLECEMALKKLTEAGKDAADPSVLHWTVRLGLVEEDFIMIDDRLEFLRKNSDLAARSKAHGALAAKMEELQSQDQLETAESKEWLKLKKRAESELKEQAQRDQALLVSQKYEGWR